MVIFRAKILEKVCRRIYNYVPERDFGYLGYMKYYNYTEEGAVYHTTLVNYTVYSSMNNEVSIIGTTN